MLVLYLVFDQFVWKPQRQSAAQAALSEEVATPPETASTPDSTITSPVVVDSLFATAASEEIVVLENNKLRVELSNRGAVIKAIRLKEFEFGAGVPVNLIPEGTSILGSSIYSMGKSQNLGDHLFVAQTDSLGKTVRFILEGDGGALIQRTYSLDDAYGIHTQAEIQNMGSVNGMRFELTAGIADSEKNTKSKAQDYRFMLYADNEILKVPLSKMRKSSPQGSFGSFGWAASRSKYFALALKESEPALSKSFSANVNPDTGNPGFAVDSYQEIAKATWQQGFVLYAGPADPSILGGYGKQMENIAERGANWLRWLTNIIAIFLSWLHGYIRNYGVVLIILALVLKVVLHPLTHKSMQASFKMQKIQPQMQFLQKKYKDDPRTLQLEMSKLYKEAGANPLSGCLPLLLQMPIFISLYNVLRYSLDMRNAGFVLWLKDLSEPDPYLILPIIMGIFMVIQSLMMQPPKADPKDMDDKQRAAQSSQKMMTWMMPIMMFFIFRNMPAGLVLYWTVFNIFSVIQQYYLLKQHRNKE